MANASFYRDPLESAVARVAQLERDKAELLALTAGIRRANRRRRAGFAAAVVLMLLAGPVLAWVVRGKMPPPPPATRTYEGKYTLSRWTTTSSDAPVTGPMTLSVDPATGKARGWATGPIGSVHVTAQVHDRDVHLLAISPDGDSRGVGSALVIGDAITGAFGVPNMAASAGFVIETKQ